MESLICLQDLLYALFQVDDENPTIVGSAYFLHKLLTKPSLQRTTAWGSLNKAPNGAEEKNSFLGDFGGYVSFLESKSFIQTFV